MRTIAVLVILSLVSLTQAARAESQPSLCDKALASCKQVVQDYKDLQASDEEIKQILKQQRDEAIAKQGSNTLEKLQYVAIGAGTLAFLCLIFKCNK